MRGVSSKVPYTMFGFSHFFGDIVDCIDSRGGYLQQLVLNVDEKPISGRVDMGSRVARLHYPVDVRRIETFQLFPSEMKYVIGFSGKLMIPLKEQLAAFVKTTPYELRFDRLVHSRAIVQSGAEIQEGVIIDAGAIVGPWASIGKHTILNRGSSVGHDCKIGAYCFLGPSATLCSHVQLGQGVKVGANATILPDVWVGEDAVIAAGAVVKQNVPAGAMVAGVPAVIKKRGDYR